MLPRPDALRTGNPSKKCRMVRVGSAYCRGGHAPVDCLSGSVGCGRLWVYCNPLRVRCLQYSCSSVNRYCQYRPARKCVRASRAS